MTQIHKFFQVTRVTLFTYIEEYFSGSHFLFLSIFCRFQIPASLLIGIYWAVINSNNINFCTCKKEKWFVSILHLLQDLYYHVSSLCLTANFHENFKKKKKGHDLDVLCYEWRAGIKTGLHKVFLYRKLEHLLSPFPPEFFHFKNAFWHKCAGQNKSFLR